MARAPRKKASPTENPVNKAEKGNRIRLVAKTEAQLHYIRSIKENALTFGVGPAGTGKTFIAASLAAKELMHGKVDRIIITRPAVEPVGERHGFLPGGLLQKLAPWARPVVDILKKYLGDAMLQQALKEGVIEVIPFSFMQGLTFDKAFVMLDEAQNTTPLSMELFLTRIGEGARVVVDGDLRQSYIPVESGLAVALELAEDNAIPCGLIRFGPDDVVRSGMAREWVKAFSGRGV